MMVNVMKNFTQEMATLVMKECKNGAYRAATKYGLQSVREELEGQLIEDILKRLDKKDNVDITYLKENLALIRRMINHFAIDFYRKNNDYLRFEKTFTQRENERKSRDNEEMVTLDKDMFKQEMSRKSFTEVNAMKEQITLLLSRLSSTDQEIFQLMFVEGHKPQYIREMLGCSVNTPRNAEKRIIALAEEMGMREFLVRN
jgi:DNA-directed RNA polymerase specialized sigma24 family protein